MAPVLGRGQGGARGRPLGALWLLSGEESKRCFHLPSAGSVGWLHLFLSSFVTLS